MGRGGPAAQEGELEAETEMEEAQKIHQIQEEMVERQQLAAEVEGLEDM